ncbi:MAG: helix-turn-helix transcriptional regulator [Leptolyngbyaceae cyanobacterium bins.302]|nr:helix-turn-helix transcriptional regulator [Leptolyngbyaceae cyanobacterium bins.302]
MKQAGTPGSDTPLSIAAIEVDVVASETETKKAVATKPKRRGRYHSFERPPTHADLFPNGETDRMASNKVIWEGCNILSQGRDIGWVEAGPGSPYYESSVAKGKGYLSFWITNELHVKHPTVLEEEAALALIDQFDIRAACLHLIYAAYATQLERPWEQQFVLNDRQLERYLGLDKNKKLNKQQKLELLLELAKQPCHLLVYVSWPEKGKVKSFSVSRTWLWEISEPILHFQEDLMGNSEMVGFTLQVKAGNWAQYFLNPSRCKDGNGYYEYGILSQCILQDLMTIWYNHEGAARLILWLLFKTKVGNGPVRAGTLFKVAFGTEKVEQARKASAPRKRLVSQWKTTLKVLDEQGWKFTFDLATYPPQYLPDLPDLLPLTDIPDDPEQAAEFWLEDGAKGEGDRLTDTVKRPYGGFEQLLTARMVVQPPEEISKKLEELKESRPVRSVSAAESLSKLSSDAETLPPSSSKSKSRKSERRLLSPEPSNQLPETTKPTERIDSGEKLKALRLTRGMTQSVLAAKIGKSTSWVKLVETGRRSITPEDQTLLLTVLQATI